MSCGYDDRALYLRLKRAAVAARKLGFDRDAFLKFSGAAFDEAIDAAAVAVDQRRAPGDGSDGAP